MRPIIQYDPIKNPAINGNAILIVLMKYLEFHFFSSSFCNSITALVSLITRWSKMIKIPMIMKGTISPPKNQISIIFKYAVAGRVAELL